MLRKKLEAFFAVAAVVLFLIGIHTLFAHYRNVSAIAENSKAPSQPAVSSAAVPAPTNQPAPLKLKVVATAGKKQLTFGELIDLLMQADIICVGEQHDNALNHQVQLQIIKALYARDERIGAGMEMFQKPFQQVIDDYIAGKISEEKFLADTEYKKRWGFDWQLYRPIVEFCRRNEIPLSALNVRKELIHRVYKNGFAGLTDEEKKELGPIDFQVKAHRDYWYERLPQMHGQQNPTTQQKDRSYEIMTIWDDYMAQSAAAFKKDRNLSHLVVLAGVGHVAGGFGIPDRASRYAGGAKTATIRVVVENDGAEPDEGSDLPVDFVVYVQK